MRNGIRKDKKVRLSPIPYIKNNRGRTMALVISIGLFGVMLYVLGFFLGTIKEPYGEPIYRALEHYTLIYEDSSKYGEMDYDLPFEDRVRPLIYKEAEVLSKDSGLTVIPVRRGVFAINGSVGQSTLPIFYFDKKEYMDLFSENIGAELVSGRLPEAPGELVVDTCSAVNQGDQLLRYVNDKYKIVGQVKCDYYTVFGYPITDENNYMCMAIHDGPVTDLRKDLEAQGHEFSYWYDIKDELKSQKSDLGAMDTIKYIFTGVSTGLLLLCVLVVLSLHIRDRHEEWCLLNSIGYSVGEIYIMAIKELLISFGIAAAGGIVISAVAVFVINRLICIPKALVVRTVRPEDMLLIACVFLVILALCHMPMFLQLRRITTVDDIE